MLINRSKSFRYRLHAGGFGTDLGAASASGLLDTLASSKLDFDSGWCRAQIDSARRDTIFRAHEWRICAG